MIRFVRQRNVRVTRERWILRGIVKIVTHPLPPEQADDVRFVPRGTAAWRLAGPQDEQQRRLALDGPPAVPP